MGLYSPDLSTRLYSPQTHFDDFDDNAASMLTTNKKIVLSLPGQGKVTVPLDSRTRLPIMKCFGSVDETAESIAAVGCVSHEVNQNLTAL